MTKPRSRRPQPKAQPTPKGSGGGRAGLIHPVIIFPFRPSEDASHLAELYGLATRLADAPETYARPLTVLDSKTRAAFAGNRRFARLLEGTVAARSEVVEAWCVDTCQMWYTGLGLAYERGKPGDVYWLIPGDFDYGSPLGRDVLSRLHDLPEICVELGQDICVGEIATDHNHPKQLIDTYGTFALLYNWFPQEGREIRQYTERPRSEFFAVGHDFLGEMLTRRWYAYEQTVVMLLHAVSSGRRLSRFFVGNISDLPGGRETVASAIQQVERTERLLKSLWRERNEGRPQWLADYRLLEDQSDRIRRSALIILESLLA